MRECRSGDGEIGIQKRTKFDKKTGKAVNYNMGDEKKDDVRISLGETNVGLLRGHGSRPGRTVHGYQTL